jgi:hypothetical protein
MAIMPRAQVYITQNNYKRIQDIVDAKKDDGADRTEANISSVAAMLLDVGLRVYEFQQKKEQDDASLNENSGDDGGMPEQRELNKIMLENVLKASYASTIILQMMGVFDEVKRVDAFNFMNVREEIKNSVNVKLNDVFHKSDLE